MSVTKIGKVKTSGGTVDYIFKKQKDVAEQPKVIGGNILGTTKKEIKAEFLDQEKLNSKVQNTTTHFSISFLAGQTVSDEVAADFADELMRALDYDKNPYIVVRHFDKEDRELHAYAHIHIGASRIKDDGTLIPEWEIAEKAIEATKEIDKLFGLESVTYVRLNAAEKSERNIKKDEYQMMTRNGRLSVLEEFKDCAESSLGEKNTKRDVREFVADVRLGGFEVSANVSETTGEMKGFSFSKDGIVFSAGKAGKQFKWANLSKALDYQPERDTKFLLQLKAEMLAKKQAEEEAKKQVELIVEAADELTEPVKIIGSEELIEVTENETTCERQAIEQPTANANRFATSQPAENRAGGIKFDPGSKIQTKIATVEATPGKRSVEGLSKTSTGGREFSAVRDGRTGDQTARSGQTIAADEAANFAAIKPKETGNTSLDREGERGFERDAEDDSGAGEGSRRPARSATQSRTSASLDGAGVGDGDESISELPKLGGEDQTADGDGFEFSEQPAARSADRNQRAAEPRHSTTANSGSRIKRENSGNSATNSGGERFSDPRREGARATDKPNYNDSAVFNGTVDAGSVDSGNLLLDEQRPERRISAREKDGGESGATTRSGDDGERSDQAEQRGDDQNIATNLSRGRAVLQSPTGGTRADSPKDYSKANRLAAEKTAQVINVKRFSGGLDAQIVAAWASIIEKTDAAEFLNEIIKPQSQAERQAIFEHLDRQAEIIAHNLKLPKPEPQAKIDSLKLAEVLTRIEVANYEAATGEQVNEKTFEILADTNAHRHGNVAPAPEHLAKIGENFDGLATDLGISSNLEAATLNALLDVARTGFDANLVIRAQRYVNTNEAAAREMTTLVQLAYGGQSEQFTDNFKRDLAERIYYSPAPPTEVYQDFRQLNWQRTVENFAPLVDNLAEQYQIEIKLPGTDADRNKLLADFVVQGLTEAYESKNPPLEKYVRTEIFEDFMKASNNGVQQKQKKAIDASAEENLEPPEFSHSLEASAYISTKYEDDKKADIAIKAAERIRAEAKTKAEIQMDVEKEQVKAFIFR